MRNKIHRMFNQSVHITSKIPQDDLIEDKKRLTERKSNGYRQHVT